MHPLDPLWCCQVSEVGIATYVTSGFNFTVLLIQLLTKTLVKVIVTVSSTIVTLLRNSM